MLTQNEIKQRVGIHAAGFVQQDMCIGLGTGTTVYYLLKELSRRKKEGLHFTAVCTSAQTQNILAQEGMAYLQLNDVDKLELTIDGADEADAAGNLIKGGGGALLQEKMVAAASKQLIIIVDEKKDVETLGAFPLPVEVIPFGWKQVQQKIAEVYKIESVLREKNGAVYLTDHKNYILDCKFNEIVHAAELNMQLHLIPGVVETGLFPAMAAMVITGYANGEIKTKHFTH